MRHRSCSVVVAVAIMALATTVIAATVDTPAFSPVGGTYTTPQSVTISTVMAGTTIYYTTDGTTPTTSSAVFSPTAPISVSTTTTINAFATEPTSTDSLVATATYTFPEALRFELTWDVATDIDLHVKEPSGNEIYYGNSYSPTGSQWLTDSTAGTGPEAIWWPTNPPAGNYEFWAVNYSGSVAVNYTLNVYQSGSLTETQRGSLAATGGMASTHYPFSIAAPALQITRLTFSPGSQIVPNTSVTFTAESNNPNNATTLTFKWNVSDPSGVSDTTLASIVDPALPYTFSSYGTYTVGVWVTDGTMTSAPYTLPVTVLQPNPGADGVTNAGQTAAPIVNPTDGMSIGLKSSDGGVVVLAVDVSQMRAVPDVSTDFDGVASRSVSAGVKGLEPAAKFDAPGAYVATATATSVTNADGTNPQARRTIVISDKEVGQRSADIIDPSSTKVVAKALKGKFGFTADKIAKGDTVTLGAQVELPIGLNLKNPQELSLGIGNILDHVALDAKGRAVNKSLGEAGTIKKVSVKYPKPDKATGLITADIPVTKRMATITITLFTKGMVARGFNTEGVVPNATANNLKIQVGFVLGGVAYENTVAVTLKVAKKKDTGSIGFSRSGN